MIQTKPTSTVRVSTIKHQLCIGCGVCQAACPHGAVEIARNKYKEFVPTINQSICTKCGLCVRFCPNTKEKFAQEATKVATTVNPSTFGIDDAQFYLAWNADDQERIKSASGGALTKFAKYLLRKNYIDGVVHARPRLAKTGESHYEACLTSSVEMLEKRAGSFYSPICFAEVLQQLEPNKNYLFIATPCIIRAAKKLFAEHEHFKSINVITCALVCSHNVNGQFADYFAELHNLPADTDYYVNMRNKDNIPDANSYNNHYYTTDKDLLKINRFKSGYTELWRNYYFAMNCCNYCADFWGYEADISVKDAWGQWASDPLGKSIVILRNKQIEYLFLQCGIEYRRLELEVMKDHQKATSDYKQVQAKNKEQNKLFSPVNRRSGFTANKITAQLSRWTYGNLGFAFTKNVMPFVDQILRGPKIDTTYGKAFLRANWQHLCEQLKSIFIYKRDGQSRIKQILVAGGYGYGNVGDEAQCNQTVKILAQRYSDYQVKILTPNPYYSFQHHQVASDFASRVLFFNQGWNYNCYDFDSSLGKRIWFIISAFVIYLNAFLVRADLPTFFINAKKAKLLEDIKTAKLFYFCGGGYLTGSTRSRLWDGVMLCRLCYVFRTPVVMSGQTIGVWGGWLNESFARWGFKYVNLIAVRDGECSIKDLEQIGVTGARVLAAHDDALFCDKAQETRAEVNKPYIAVNFHYWGMINSEKQLCLNRIKGIIQYVLQCSDYNILFVPMYITDKESYDDFASQCPSERVQCLNYDYDFRVARRAIADAEMCITMKHHPIVFAMGEQVPTISLVYSSYYAHKNIGALALFGQERFSVTLEDAAYFEMFKVLFEEIRANRFVIQNEIVAHRNSLMTIHEDYFSRVDKIIL